jgi:hypothetical protein
MKVKRQKLIRLTFFLSLIILINYSPIIYYKIFPEEATWPNFYNYPGTSNEEILAAIERIGDKNISITYIRDTCTSTNSYVQVVFYDKLNNEFYHSWVGGEPTTYENRKYTQIIFGYLSNSVDDTTGKKINVDYDLLTNYLTEKHFEDLVINKLKLKAN